MKRFWEIIFGLNYERSIWVDHDDLGNYKVIEHKKRRYEVKIPNKIKKKVTLQLRGLGKSRWGKTGDLLLLIWLNQGDDIRKSLWLSNKDARNGAEKKMSLIDRKIWVTIPPKSYHGLTLRLKGLGKEPDIPLPPSLFLNRGNLLVKLMVYPDSIFPKYGAFELLATDDMALEGWVYRKIDEIFSKIGKSSFPTDPIHADRMANLFNEFGYIGIFRALVDHFGLKHLKIEIINSNVISLPGCCKTTTLSQDFVTVGREYLITINNTFLDNPFSVAAIIAHELCHVVFTERIDNKPTVNAYITPSEQAAIEMERTVDLLVFMYKVGEFQLRVSRDERLTLGYFNQKIFERMQVIVSRKLE